MRVPFAACGIVVRLMLGRPHFQMRSEPEECSTDAAPPQTARARATHSHTECKIKSYLHTCVGLKFIATSHHPRLKKCARLRSALLRSSVAKNNVIHASSPINLATTAAGATQTFKRGVGRVRAPLSKTTYTVNSPYIDICICILYIVNISI